jgi:hypothetical protein
MPYVGQQQAGREYILEIGIGGEQIGLAEALFDVTVARKENYDRISRTG